MPHTPPHSPGFRLGAIATLVAISATLGASCRSKGSPAPAASASASASAAATAYRPNAEKLAEGIPVDREVIEKAVNPKKEKPYSGPTGTVAGVVSVKGDEAPEVAETLAKIPSGKCDLARTMYAKLFREGMMRTLADVLVTVTGYDGYVPAKGLVVPVEARGCTWGVRTIGVTFGQRLEVVSKDGKAYLPKLTGARQTAVMATVPGGDPIKIYPNKPAAHFRLEDPGRPFMAADVFVVKFATFDVTGLDGRFEIRGVPVGEVKVGAVLPSTFQSTEKTVEVREGKTTEIDLEILFDAKKHVRKTTPPPVPTIR